MLGRDRDTPDCIGRRLAFAGQLVDNGEWASGHAIVKRVISCAERDGCPEHQHCVVAAHGVLCRIRTALSH